MDEQGKDQDLVINGDGSMGQGGETAEPKVDASQQTEPDVNSIMPPSEESDSPESSDDSSVESAVNFIAGGNSSEAVESEEKDKETSDSSGETIPVKTESSNGADDVKEEPVPVSAEGGPTEASPSSGTEEIGSSPENEIQEQNNSNSIDSNKPSEIPASNNDTGMSNNEQSQPHPHRNNKKLATIVTVLVALLLAGAAVYLYTSAQDNTVQSDTSNIEINKTTTVIVPATSEDIDQVVAEIDETLNSLSEEGLEEDSLTDETLGIQ